MEQLEKEKFLKKMLSEIDIVQLQNLKTEIELGKVVVTCMGLYNHGKSTLLNALINDYEQQTFKTADVRETITNKSAEQENIIFVDTPGLNAREDDDKRVMDAIKKSDLNLFVHTVTAGEFTEKEVDFLHKVKKHWKNPQEFIKRTIFVISKIDKADSKADIDKTIIKMRDQIQSIFSIDSMFISVSAIRYIKGKIGEKKNLVKKSNLEELLSALKELREMKLANIQETKVYRLEKYYQDLINRFNSKLQENKLQLTELKRAANKVKKDILRVEGTLQKKYDKLEVEL